MRKFILRYWPLILLVLIALFIRLYRLPATLIFLEDEGRDLLIVKRMIDTLRPVLLGPQTSTGNMYLGPLYYYFITPAVYLARMSPLGPAILIAITGAATVGLLYFYGKRWFSSSAGWLAATLYALMPLPVQFTRNSWNPNLVPLISLLIVILVVNLSTHVSQNWKRDFLFLGAAVGFLVQLHYMALIFLVGVAIVMILTWYKKWRQLILGIGLSLVTFVFTLSPFIIFEIRNDFVNTHAITRFIEAKEEHNIRYKVPFAHWENKVTDTTTRLFSSLLGTEGSAPDPYRLPITIAAVALISLGLLTRSRTYFILFGLTVIPLLLVGIYQENVHLHYLGFLFPLIYLLPAAVPRGRWLLIICLLYAVPQTYRYVSWQGNNQLIRAQEVADYVVQKSAGRPYNLASIKDATISPYLYYSRLSSNPPTTQSESTLFLICQDQLCSDPEINSPNLFLTGPSHPTLTAYLGHPLVNDDSRPRRIVSQEHVSHGAWVVEVQFDN